MNRMLAKISQISFTLLKSNFVRHKYETQRPRRGWEDKVKMDLTEIELGGMA
jgi:hypothetical protein